MYRTHFYTLGPKEEEEMNCLIEQSQQEKREHLKNEVDDEQDQGVRKMLKQENQEISNDHCEVISNPEELKKKIVSLPQRKQIIEIESDSNFSSQNQFKEKPQAKEWQQYNEGYSELFHSEQQSQNNIVVENANQFEQDGQQEKQQQQRRSRLRNKQKRELKTFIYISDNSFALQIFQLFVDAGRFKYTIQDHGALVKQYNKVQKLQLELQQKVKTVYTKEEISDPEYFFIRKKCRQYIFRNGKLIDQTNYTGFLCPYNLTLNYQNIYNITKLVCKQLDGEFIEELKIILDTFCTMHSQDYCIDAIINNILSKCEEMKYLTRWNYVKTNFKSYIILVKQLDLVDKQGKHFNKTADKVKQKYKKLIQKQQEELDLETRLPPLEYLLNRLFSIFVDILNRNELNEIIDQCSKLEQK